MIPRRVVFVHHHLRGGGVARVIEQAQHALRRLQISTVVCIGEAPPSDSPVENIQVVPGLGYGASTDAPAILVELEEAARRSLGGPPDLWHFHNHGLGKNLVTPMVVRLLADRGERLLLQIHDFAEDGRPANYAFLRQGLSALGMELGNTVYPCTGNVHFALLNRRDLRFMARAGALPDRIHHLPNPVSREDAAGAEPPDTKVPFNRLVLYPTRAIRRKNLGEFLLWAAMQDNRRDFALTLAPKTPAEQPRYDAWVDFARHMNLPVHFDASRTYGYAALLKAAEVIFTTSVGEGFGLAFLEPWLIEKPLFGRKLPEITGEFEEEGVKLHSMYARLEIPLTWVGAERLRDHIAGELTDAVRQYGRQTKAGDVDAAYAAAVIDGTVDFGRLNEPMQMEIIARICDHRASRHAVVPSRFDAHAVDVATLEENARTVGAVFNLNQYGRRLSKAYERVLESPSQTNPLDANVLLDEFLDPARFFLLRT